MSEENPFRIMKFQSVGQADEIRSKLSRIENLLAELNHAHNMLTHNNAFQDNIKIDTKFKEAFDKAYKDVGVYVDIVRKARTDAQDQYKRLKVEEEIKKQQEAQDKLPHTEQFTVNLAPWHTIKCMASIDQGVVQQFTMSIDFGTLDENILNNALGMACAKMTLKCYRTEHFHEEGKRSKWLHLTPRLAIIHASLYKTTLRNSEFEISETEKVENDHP
jgi:hypothetical protein